MFTTLLASPVFIIAVIAIAAGLSVLLDVGFRTAMERRTRERAAAEAKAAASDLDRELEALLQHR